MRGLTDYEIGETRPQSCRLALANVMGAGTVLHPVDAQSPRASLGDIRAVLTDRCK